MRLWFCLGTAAELIKVYSLIRFAQNKNIDWFVLTTGQSPINFRKQWEDFQLPLTHLGEIFDRKKDLSSFSQAIFWFQNSVRISRKKLLKRIFHLSHRTPSQEDVWVVHGDTLSTLLGSIFCKRLGLKLSHLEAGLRSFHLFKPFPEEIVRGLVSRLAQYHFVQDQKANENLEKMNAQGKIVCTQANTLKDSLELVIKEFDEPKNIERQPFALANIHRFENLHSSRNWSIIVQVLAQAAKKIPILLVLHPPTEAKLKIDHQSKSILEKAGVQLLPRLPFSEFIHYLKKSEFIITDGGSNQEECSYLNKPCLILRNNTERYEGLEGPCVLSKFNPKIIQEFLNDPKLYQNKNLASKKNESPTEIFFGTLFQTSKEKL